MTYGHMIYTQKEHYAASKLGAGASQAAGAGASHVAGAGASHAAGAGASNTAGAGASAATGASLRLRQNVVRRRFLVGCNDGAAAGGSSEEAWLVF